MTHILVSALILASIIGAFAKASLQPVDYLQLQTTPASSRIVEKDTMHIGWFTAPFENTSVKTGLCSHPLRRKQWQFISLTSADYIIGFSTVNVGYLSTCFVYCFNIRTKSFIEFEDNGFGGRRSRIAPNSISGTSSYSSRYCSVAIENHYRDGYFLAKINCTDKNSNSMAGTVKIHVKGDPMVNIREIAPKRLVYTHQSTAYRPEGSLVCNGDTIRLTPLTDFAGFDYTQGRHLYKTDWNWAAAGGFAADSTPVNVCFSTGTGFFYWINGKISRINNINFNYENHENPWQIASPDSVVSLSFVPLGKRTGKINVLGLIASYFYQPFGTFSGTIRPVGSQPVTIERMLGVTEEHRAKW